jgi:DNA polymerase-3 subunit alpha
MEFNSYPLLEKDFFQWCSNNHLKIEPVTDHIFNCGDMVFLLLEEKDGNVCDADYHFILNDYEKKSIKSTTLPIDAVVYKWGTKFCYTKVAVMDQPDNDNVKEFKYLGTTTLEVPNLPFLGIHGQYEILNGSRNYDDWVAKAKFLQVPTLGICEKNTLAGTMAFQQACGKGEIKSILGETITISNGNDLFCEGKIYALTADGWKNVLQTNAEINVINPSQFVLEDRLLQLGKGVAFVFDPLQFPYDKKTVKKYMEAFDQCYFKLDTVEFENPKTDMTFLERTQEYLNNDLGLQPIIICDAYYLDETDFEIKKDLNLISGVKSAVSKNQYFKADDENLVLFADLFKDEDFSDVIGRAIESLTALDEAADFSIPTGKFKLPRYKMTPEEIEKYGDADTMFDSLCVDGWERLKIAEKPNVEVYLDRLQEEIEVIRGGGYIDYFLILHDIIRWCEKNDILVGVGRGCFLGDNRVLLFNGQEVPIKDVEVGQEVQNYFNQKSIIEDKYEYEVNEEVVELDFGETKITCTKDHKFYTNNRGWVCADQLTEYDDVCFVD